MDRVNLQDNERLDIPDALNLQELTYEYIGRCLGGLLGRVSGCLDPPKFTVDTVNETISIGAGLFYTFDLVDGHVFGKVLRMNPIGVEQSTQSSVSVSYSGSNVADNHAIWCKRKVTDPGGNSPAESRKFWNTAGGVEVVQNLPPKHIEVLEFSWGTSPPAAGDGWFPIAVVIGSTSANLAANSSWGTGAGEVGNFENGDYDAAGNPVPRPFYAWDYNSPKGSSDILSMYNFPVVQDYGLVNYGKSVSNSETLDPSAVETAGADTTGETNSPVGLAGMLRDIRWMLSQLQESNAAEWDNNWLYKKPLVANTDGSVPTATAVGFKGLKEMFDYVNNLIGVDLMKTAGLDGSQYPTGQRAKIDFKADLTGHLDNPGTPAIGGAAPLPGDSIQSQIDALAVQVNSVRKTVEGFAADLEGDLRPSHRIITSIAFDHDPRDLSGAEDRWFCHGYGLAGMHSATNDAEIIALSNTNSAGFLNYNALGGSNTGASKDKISDLSYGGSNVPGGFSNNAGAPQAEIGTDPHSGLGGTTAAHPTNNLRRGTYRFTIDGDAHSVFVSPKNPGHGYIDYGFGESTDPMVASERPRRIYWPEFVLSQDIEDGNSSLKVLDSWSAQNMEKDGLGTNMKGVAAQVPQLVATIDGQTKEEGVSDGNGGTFTRILTTVRITGSLAVFNRGHAVPLFQDGSEPAITWIRQCFYLTAIGTPNKVPTA